jgi:signal transduction histidine kinase
LIKRKNGLILTVMDNGKGITRKLIYSHDSLGITGMRERALALGGTFTLGGSRSKGTTLTVQIPLSRVIIRTTPSSSRNTPQF